MGLKENVQVASRAASAVLSRRVSHLILFVTARCNLLCKHCFYTDEIKNAKKERELTAGEYERIAQHAGPLLNVNFTGGEPFVRRDLPEIIGSFRRHTGAPFAGITTNGLLRDRILKDVDLICSQPGLYHLKLGVSLDGLEEQHDSIRGRAGVFRETLETIYALDALRSKHKRLMVYISTTLTKHNKKRITEFIDFVRQNLPVDAHYLGCVRGKPMEPDAKEVTAEEYWEATRHLRQRWNSKAPWYNGLHWVNSLMYRVNQEVMSTNRYWLPCVAGQQMLTITEEGLVKPCEMLEQIGGASSVMGDIREHGYDIGRVLDTFEAKTIRHQIVSKRCFCTFENACQASLIHQPHQMLRASMLKMSFSKTNA